MRSRGGTDESAGGEARRGLRRWRLAIWAVFAPLYFWSHFHRIAPAVVATDLMAAFRTTGAELGILSAVYPYVFFLMALPAGALADTLGPRRTVGLGAATMGLGAIGFALASTLRGAVGGRLLVGLGASVILVAFMRLCVEWFRPERLASLTGLAQMIGNVGGLVAAGPLALLVERVGWRSSFALIGVATIALAAGWWAVVRDRPEERGLPPVVARPPGGPAGGPPPARPSHGLVAVLANPRSWPAPLAAAGVYGTTIAFLGLWAIPYLTQVYRLSRVEATTYTSAAVLGLIVGSPAIGWISDRGLERRRGPLAACGAIYLGCWALLALPPAGALPLPALLPVCVLLGVGASGGALIFACVREVNAPAHTGMALGFANALTFLGIGLAQWGMGAVLDARWAGAAAGGVRLYPPEAYRAAFLLCLAVAGAALVMAAAVTETRGPRAWTPGGAGGRAA